MKEPAADRTSRAGRQAPDRRLWVGIIIACLMVCALPAPLAAGGSLELPDGWLSLEARGITIHHRPDNATLAAGLQRDGPAIRDRVAQLLGPEAGRPVQVILLPASGRHADEVAPRAPAWAAGFTIPGSGVLFIRVGTLGVYPDRDLASVFAHELAHAVFGDLSSPHRLPRWFEEGSCMVVARPWDLGDSLRLTLAVLFHGESPLTSYELGFPADAAQARAAYAQSFSFVSWLAEEHGGARALASVARLTGQGRPFSDAFAAVFQMTPEQAAGSWRGTVGRWYKIISIATGTTTFWIVATLLFTLVMLRKRRRTRATLERWEEEERRLDP